MRTAEACLWRVSEGTVWKEVWEVNPQKTWGNATGDPRQTYLGVGAEKEELGTTSWDQAEFSVHRAVMACFAGKDSEAVGN